MAKDILETATFDATPAVVYRAFVDAKQHAAFTRSRATNDGKVAGPFSAYDGYIVGFNLELEKGVRLVQAWRANDWKEGEWSIARFDFTAAGTGGTRVTLTQSGVPKEHVKRITAGWTEFYWTPLAAWLKAKKSTPARSKAKRKR